MAAQLKDKLHKYVERMDGYQLTLVVSFLEHLFDFAE